MGHRFADLLFSPSVKAVQNERDSRRIYQRWEGGADSHHRLEAREIQFLQQRDSFYLASVNPDGWPYIQHRGGPKGFLKVLDAHHLGFADYTGNRQYITTGNLRENRRVALFLMDYPNRRRLKLLGYAQEVAPGSAALAELCDPDYGATPERGFIIQVAAFDWNCSQHIVPRYDQAALDSLIAQHKELP
ncbi:pyridoxamine 5'-phosphate oxidase family protein [Ketobacter sp.]|uniref:pyridoxamine 5'-phosphate oxidase family protein n=1 Tax=Ketobacter sp. TaxID=2083498 RepID=UPI000F1FC927|nr:pyridoxamine 5'-phosphate oxidase family protein [Ketobacter sp.]RLU01257.1 MAG: pyridoxamine 5-phosphate oxidase [Ketobacter sp.]